jgi:hypothetical protein
VQRREDLVWQLIFRCVSGHISGNKLKREMTMVRARPSALAKHRARLKQRGLVRVEVQVAAADVDLIRRTARSLRNEEQGANRLRAQLLRLVGAPTSRGLKELLAAAPLEEIELTRIQDHGRDVEL